MGQTKRHTKGLWLVVLILALIIGFKFQTIVLAPNSFILGDGTDGFRSYMAASYHLTHDSTYSHYTGMNYPYGDRNDFTDNLPILTNSVKFVSENIIDVKPWFMGIWNYFLLSSLLLTGVFLYLIFRRLNLPLWYAVPITVGITLLSPQISRMDGHYGLAHPFLTPMIIYLLLCFENKPTFFRSILIGIGVLACSWFHFYLFIIPLLILGFYYLVKLLANLSLDNFRHVTTHGVIQVLLPFLIVYFGGTIFDPVTDRPEWPYGFFAYRGYWQSILFPGRGALGDLINTYFPTSNQPGLENMGYIGLTGLLFFGVMLVFSWKIWAIKTPIKTMTDADFKTLKILLLSGVLVFLLSLGLPFVIPGLKNYLAHTGPYRQFRSVGRLSWGFFYLINISAFYFGYHFFNNIKKKPLRLLLLFTLVAMMLIDGFSYFLKKEWKYTPHPNNRNKFKRVDNPWLNNLEVASFQAMIPLPAYIVGSENISYTAHYPIMHRSLWASLQTGLPVMGYFMGRTSISQTYKYLELISKPYRIPEILEELPNDKDLLIFGEKGNLKDVPERYDQLWKNLPQFYEDERLILYRLPLQTIRDRVKEEQVNAIKESRDNRLFVHGAFRSTDSIPDFIYKNFDENKTPAPYEGTGSFTDNGFPAVILFEEKLPNAKAGDRYSIRYWYRIKKDLKALVIVDIDEINEKNGERVAREGYRLSKSIEYIDGEWALIVHTYQIKNPANRLRISLGHPKLADQKIEMDELLIIPEGEQIYRYNDKEVWKGIRKFEQINLIDSLKNSGDISQ